MSASGTAKVRNYYARGQRALTIQEVGRVLGRYPFLAPPKNVLILDGVVDAGSGVAVGLTPSWEPTMILTPIADEETVAHEYVHQAFGLGELATRLVTPAFMLRGRLTLLPKPVSYNQCVECSTHPEYINEALQSYGLQPEFQGIPDVRHYKLTTPIG